MNKDNRITAQDVDPARQVLESLIKSFAVYDLSKIQRKVILSQNCSNPFNRSTRIEYHLSEDGWVRLTIYTRFGREISTLIDINGWLIISSYLRRRICPGNLFFRLEAVVERVLQGKW
jgi:hypothetical protein